jgi:hypothetical protein
MKVLYECHCVICWYITLIFIDSELLNGDECFVGFLFMSDFFEFASVYEYLNSLYFRLLLRVYDLHPCIQYILESSLGAVISEKNTIHWIQVWLWWFSHCQLDSLFCGHYMKCVLKKYLITYCEHETSISCT